MATFQSVEAAGFLAVPPNLPVAGAVGGKLRRYRGTFPLTAQASGDVGTIARVPAGSVFAFGIITADATLGAAATVAIGTAATPGKYRAAATFTTPNTPTLFGIATAMDDPPVPVPGASAQQPFGEEVIVTVGAAALPGAGNLVIDLYYSGA